MHYSTDRSPPASDHSLIKLKKLQQELAHVRTDLHVHEVKYQQLLKALPNIVWITDAEGAIVDLNPTWTEVTGIECSESLGYGFLKAIHPQDRDRLLFHWRSQSAQTCQEVDLGTASEQAQYQPSGFCFKYRLVRSNGLSEWFSAHALPVIVADNQLKEWVTIHTSLRSDLGAKPRANLAASHSEPLAQRPNRLSGLQGRAVAPVAKLNQNSNLDRFVELSAQQRQMLLQQQQQIQQQQQQLQEIRQLNSCFLSTVSHELRTPMHAIIGFSQLLLRQQLPQQTQAHIASRILENGRHLSALINDMLDLSRLEMGSLSLKPETLDLAALVTNIVEELRPLAEEKHLKLSLCSELDKSCIVSDRQRLRQMFSHVLGNAVKFTESGSITVMLRPLSAQNVMLMIKDTGIGIEEDHLPRIFDQFWQVDQSTSRQYAGLGVGLAIAHWLARLMRGKITVDSEIGTGSTFRIELPRSLSHSAKSAP